MPKIIENVKEQLLIEAKKQIGEFGYGGTTIRSIANACGVGVGTVYNYFESKDMIIATFMMNDWLEIVNKISYSNSDSRQLLASIYEGLVDFAKRYKTLFADKDALAVFNTVFAERHKLLRKQISAFVMPLVASGDEFAAEFISESLITWTMNGRAFDDIYNIIKKII